MDEEEQAGEVSNKTGQEGGSAGEGGAAGRGKSNEEKEFDQGEAAAAAEEEEEEEEAIEEPDEEALGQMSSVEQRLFKIRLKMNKV